MTWPYSAVKQYCLSCALQGVHAVSCEATAARLAVWQLRKRQLPPPCLHTSCRVAEIASTAQKRLIPRPQQCHAVSEPAGQPALCTMPAVVHQIYSNRLDQQGTGQLHALVAMMVCRSGRGSAVPIWAR